MYANMVCEGGGVKGIALAGAICYLEEAGYRWKHHAGTSAGAIVAALSAAGYTGKELHKILLETDYTSFSHKNLLQSLPLAGQPASLLLCKGIYTADGIETFMTRLLVEKNCLRFADVSTNGKSRLKVMASDVTRKQLLILPDDLAQFGIDPMRFEIAKAVRMSASIPFYYTPSVLHGPDFCSYIVDGGLLSNFPIWIFDNDVFPTFGLKLGNKSNTVKTCANTGTLDYLFEVIETMFTRNEEVYLDEKSDVRTIHIPTLGIQTTQFDLSKQDSEALFRSGYQAARRFCATWSYEAFRKQYPAHSVLS